MYGTQLRETFLVLYHKQSDGVELATEMGLILCSCMENICDVKGCIVKRD
jgi:hypothetical protein